MAPRGACGSGCQARVRRQPSTAVRRALRIGRRGKTAAKIRARDFPRCPPREWRIGATRAAVSSRRAAPAAAREGLMTLPSPVRVTFLGNSVCSRMTARFQARQEDRRLLRCRRRRHLPRSRVWTTRCKARELEKRKTRIAQLALATL